MKFQNLFLFTVCVSVFTGCQKTPTGSLHMNPAGSDGDVLFQYSTLGSLMAGIYDGDLTFEEILQHGDFGLGTFNALDGEMIETGHEVFQIRADGLAYPVDPAMKSPFAVVTWFETDENLLISEPTDYNELKTVLDEHLPTLNIPYAIRISGTFGYMKTRSVPAQEKPYPPLPEVLEDQPTFEFEDTDGVMAGFRLPVYMDVANAPGYHFHFITESRDAGGHVLEFQMENLTVEIDHTDAWYTLLPGDDAFYHVVFSEEDYQ